MRCSSMIIATLASLASGCATLSVSSQQSLQLLAFDAFDRPVPNMQCRLSNDHGEWTARTPAAEVPVRRSSSDLLIECRRGNDIAMGTVPARRDNLEQAMLPFGSVGVALDHLTGHLYSYPTVVRLRLGQHLRYEFSTEARAAGLVATVGESTVVDLGAPAPRREPLPGAGAVTTAPAPAPAPARPAAPTRAVRSKPASAAVDTRRTAPVNW